MNTTVTAQQLGEHLASSLRDVGTQLWHLHTGAAPPAGGQVVGAGDLGAGVEVGARIVGKGIVIGAILGARVDGRVGVR